MPIILCLVGLLLLLVPGSVSKRAMTGLQSRDSYEITAGRLDDIWIPLIQEISKSPLSIIIGRGRHAIIFSEAYNANRMHRTGHAHNMYLDTLLDSGLTGLTFFLGFFLFYLKQCFAYLNKSKILAEDRELLFGVIVSIVCFLLAGFTGRAFFPTLDNYPIWLVIAAGAIIINQGETKNGKRRLLK